MEIVFKHGPWNTFWQGRSGEHDVQLLFDDQSTVLSIVWDVQGNETVGLVLEWLRIFVTEQNPGMLMEKAGFDCIEIGKKENNEMHWFVLVHSPPTYAVLEQEKIDQEMEEAYFAVLGSEKKLLAISTALGISLRRMEETPTTVKSVFFGTPIFHQTLAHKIAQEKAKQEQPNEFKTIQAIPQGEFWIGLDNQKQLVKEPLGLFRRTLILDGQMEDRLHAMHILIESALLSSVPVIVFDAGNHFVGLQQANQDRSQLEKARISLEPIGFPIASFSIPEKVRINLSQLDLDAVLELFRAGKNPAVQTIQKILANNKASNLSQLIEAIQTQPPMGESTAYQLKKAVRISLLIEKNYPGFFNGPNELKELAKSWSSGLGRAGLIRLDNQDDRIKIILFHALLRELKQYFKNVNEPRPVKAMVFLPEAHFLQSPHFPWKILKVIEQDLQEASSFGIGTVIGLENALKLGPRLVSETQSQINIVNQDDIGVRIENRKPYRARLRPPLSTCVERKIPNENALQNLAPAVK